MSDLSPADFSFLADMLLKEGGMVVEPDKQYLIATRLTPVATQRGLADIAELIAKLRTGNEALKHDVVDAMTVNETSFFRDPRVWREIGEILLPQLFEQCKVMRRLNIWIAASSSGQEVYTLAMLLRETLGSEWDKWRISIIASDLSREMVRRTTDASYSDYEVRRGLSTERRDRFMRKNGDSWVVNQELRDLVRPREGNLTQANMGVRGPFDLILLRNVLIYFEPAMRMAILERSADLLSKNGRLILGASEGALGVPPTLRSVRTGSLVSYGRADGDAQDTQLTPGRMSEATSSLLKQFGDGRTGTTTSPLTPAKSAPKLSSVRDEPSSLSSLRRETNPTPAPSTSTTASPTILGKAKVDDDGLTPLERLRALRKEYQQ